MGRFGALSHYGLSHGILFLFLSVSFILTFYVSLSTFYDKASEKELKKIEKKKRVRLMICLGESPGKMTRKG